MYYIIITMEKSSESFFGRDIDLNLFFLSNSVEKLRFCAEDG